MIKLSGGIELNPPARWIAASKINKQIPQTTNLCSNKMKKTKNQDIRKVFSRRLTLSDSQICEALENNSDGEVGENQTTCVSAEGVPPPCVSATVSPQVPATPSSLIILEETIPPGVEIEILDEHLNSQFSSNSYRNMPSPLLSDYEPEESDGDVEEELEHLENLTASRRGKKLKPVWEHFDTKKTKDGKIVTNKCKNCGEKVSARAKRMNVHLQQCNKGPKKNRKNLLPVKNMSASVPGNPASEPASSSSTSNPTHIKKQQFLNKYVSQVDTTYQNKISMALGKFIFSANLSFSTVENQYFKEFIQILQPAYKIPSADVVGSTILNKVFDETQIMMAEDLKGRKVFIMQDGWTTSQTEPVICHSLSTGDNTFFLDSIATEDQTKDATTCLNFLLESINTAEKDYKCEVVGLCTDNCTVMESMRNKLQQIKPDFFILGCNSHRFNNVGQHFTPEDILKKVHIVHNFIIDHHFTSARLKQTSANRPKLAGSTRWNSQINTFLRYTENHLNYVQIIRDYKSNITINKLQQTKSQKLKLKEVEDIVNDMGLFDEIEKTIKLLSPICVAIDTLQREKASAADAVNQWIDVASKIPEIYSLDDYFLKKVSEALTPVALASHILHPRYRGKNLSKEQKESGLNWLAGRNPFLLILATHLDQEKSQYLISSYFHPEFVKNSDPDEWWQAMSNQAIRPEVIEFIITLMRLPASTGSLERCFSTMNNIMTDKRNRLGIQKASKLCSVHQTLNIESNNLKNRKGTKRNLAELDSS